MPKFSVAIPAYNRPEFLHQAIGSCLNQSLGDLEVIVSDDCSSDDLASVARSFRDDRVKYHRSDVTSSDQEPSGGRGPLYRHLRADPQFG